MKGWTMRAVAAFVLLFAAVWLASFGPVVTPAQASFTSRGGYGNLPAWDGIYCEFRTDPVTSKRAGGAATGTESDRNLALFGGHGNVSSLVLEYNPIGTQTILAPVCAAGGLDLGSQDQTDNDGMQFSTGAEAKGSRAGQYVVGETPFYAAFLDVTIADVSGSDDLAFGFRKVEAAAAALDDYNDLTALNVISGTLNTSTILANAATTDTSTGVSWADTATKSLLCEVSGTGVCTWYYSTDAAYNSNGHRQPQTWTQVNSDTSFTLDDDERMGVMMYARQDADIMGVVTVRGLEVSTGRLPR